VRFVLDPHGIVAKVMRSELMHRRDGEQCLRGTSQQGLLLRRHF
jgi:hypothetical protein